MLRIRLRRTGAKKKPNYRVVVADARAPRDGTFIEILGHYNPLTDPSTFVVDAARAQLWLARGAQPSDRVARLFKREGIDAGSTGPSPEEPATVEAAPAARRRTTTKATAGEAATAETATAGEAATTEAATAGEAATTETATAGEETPARARGRRASGAATEAASEAGAETASAESEAGAPADEAATETAGQERAPRTRRTAAHAEDATETS